MSLRDQTTTPDVYEAIKPKKDCRIQIVSAEMGKPWKHKVEVPAQGYKVPGETRVMKLTIQITDDLVETENSDAKPRRKLDDMVILEPHPYINKEDGTVRFLKLEKLFQLQQFLGFEPKFVDASGEVAPHITKTGKKVCPKGASIGFREEFLDAYFDANEEPRYEAWMAIDGVASIGLKKQSEEQAAQYGVGNEVKSYAPKGD